MFTRLHESGQLSALMQNDDLYNRNTINSLIDKLTNTQVKVYLKLIRSLALVFIESARNNVICEYLIEQEYDKYLDKQKQVGPTNNQLVNNLPIYPTFAKEDISGGVKDLATSYTQIFAYVENEKPKELTNLKRLVKVSMHNVNSLMNIYGLALNLFDEPPQEKVNNKDLQKLSSAIQLVLKELKLDPASFNKILGWAQQKKTILYRVIEFMVLQEQNDLIGKIEFMVPQE